MLWRGRAGAGRQGPAALGVRRPRRRGQLSCSRKPHILALISVAGKIQQPARVAHKLQPRCVASYVQRINRARRAPWGRWW